MASIIRDVLDQARRRLAASALEFSLREASLLLAHILGCTEAEVLARSRDRLTDEQLKGFELLLTRRLSGEPMAYIRGEKEFYGRAFRVDSRVLIPRPESEHLVDTALELPIPSWPCLLDIGTGSGCLAVTLALELPAAQVVASDLAPGALAVARHNVRRHELAGRARLVAADLASGIDLSRFDLVVCNPPYVGRGEADLLSPEIREFEPDSALFAGWQGGTVHQRLLSELDDLRSGAWLVLEIGADQERLIRRLSAASAFRCLEVRPDYAGHPRVALLQRR